LFWKRASGTGSISSLLFGFVFAIVMLSLQVYVAGLDEGVEPAGWIAALTGIHFLLMATIMFVLCVIIHVVVSLQSAPPTDEQVDEFTWKPSLFKEETEELRGLPWYQNYRILAGILLLITILVVGYFW
jgi:SSS family solute:Na+ symporter